MTRRHLLWRGRPIRVSLFTCILTVIVVGPAWAQQQQSAKSGPAPASPNSGSSKPADKAGSTPADLQSRVDELQKRVDALEKDAAVADIRRELSAVRNDLAKANATATERTAAGPTPDGAWRALEIVGGLFVGAWALVSVLREGSRRQEAITNAVVKLAEASKETGDKQFKDIMTELRDLVAKTPGTSWLRRFLQI
jgi:hypothetical protein